MKITIHRDDPGKEVEKRHDVAESKWEENGR